MLRYSTMGVHFLANTKDILQAIEKLSESGATSLRMLPEDFRTALIKEASSYTYRPLTEVVGSGENIVSQQMGMFTNFTEDSIFLLLKDSFQIWLKEQLTHLGRYPFEIPLNLNAFELLKYEVGSLGITAHRDGFRYKNLICIFMIGGRGKFFVCSDRSGRHSRELDDLQVMLFSCGPRDIWVKMSDLSITLKIFRRPGTFLG